MNKKIQFSVSLLLLFLFVGFVVSINVEDYLSSTESPLSILQANYSVNGNTYTIVTIASKDSMVLKNGEIVKDIGEIKLVLKARCIDTSLPSKSSLDSIKEKVLVFNDTRNMQTSIGKLEATCDRLTGQEGENEGGCVSYETCLQTCAGHSSICGQMATSVFSFAPDLYDYANVKRSLDSNITIVLNSIADLSSISNPSDIKFNVSEKTNSLYNAISNLQKGASNYEKTPVMQVTTGFCMPFGYSVNLNKTALSSALSIASQLKQNAACFDNINSNAESIYNETFRRIDLYINTKAKANLQKQFDVLSSRYNNLTDKATSILSIVDDSNINSYIQQIDSLNQEYYLELGKNEIDQAGYTVSVISTKLDEFSSYLSSQYVVFDELATNKEQTAMLLEKAAVIISPTDAFYSDLTSINNKYNNLNKKMSEKVVYEEIQSYADQYKQLADQLNTLIDKKKTATTETVPSVLSSSLNGISSSILDAASTPLGIKEDEKRAWAQNIPLIVIVGMDVIVLAIFSIAFFFLVLRNTSAFAKQKVMNSWIIIFAVIVLLLILLSYALYTAIGNEIASTSIYNFVAEAKKSEKVYVFVEYLSSQNSSAIENCADTLASKFNSLGIQVEKIEVVDGICKDTLLSECMVQTDKLPLIQLSYSDNNSSEAKFYTFYRAEGVVKGTETYFNRCSISEFVE